MLYELTNKTGKEVIALGLGVLRPGQTRTFTPSEVEGFTRIRGVKLIEGNQPDGTELFLVVNGEE